MKRRLSGAENTFAGLSKRQNRASPAIVTTSITPIVFHRDAIIEDSKDFLRHLDQEGFAVVQCINAVRVAELKAMLFTSLHTSFGVDQQDPTTFAGACYNDRGVISNGYSGISHCKAVYEMRREALPVFQAIYGPDVPLFCSFDGVVFRPSKAASGQRSLNGAPWLHVDVDLNRSTAATQQSILLTSAFMLFASTPGTGGTCLVRGSHKEPRKYLGEAALAQKGIAFTPSQAKTNTAVQAALQANPPVHISCPAGCIILFRADTVHANTPPIIAEALSEPLLRLGCFVSFSPASHGHLQNTRRLRDNAINKHLTTSLYTFSESGKSNFPFKARHPFGGPSFGTREVPNCSLDAATVKADYGDFV